MFDETPGLCDAFYDAVGKDYPAEAAAVLTHVREENPRGGDAVGRGLRHRPDLQTVRMSVSGHRDDVALIDFHYLIGADGDVTYRQERHELGMFDWKVYVAGFERCGLRVTVDEEGLIGRGLIIGVLDEDRPHASDGSDRWIMT